MKRTTLLTSVSGRPQCVSQSVIPEDSKRETTLKISPFLSKTAHVIDIYWPSNVQIWRSDNRRCQNIQYLRENTSFYGCIIFSGRNVLWLECLGSKWQRRNGSGIEMSLGRGISGVETSQLNHFLLEYKQGRGTSSLLNKPKVYARAIGKVKTSKLWWRLQRFLHTMPFSWPRL